MDLSFVILTWNSVAHLEKCLASVARAMQGRQLEYEILVFDNGSRDGTAELLARLAEADRSHLVPFYQPENIGTTRSRNILFAAARGDYLCVMDSDVELEAGTIATLLPLLSADPRLGIVVPRVEYASGAWQKSIDRFPTLLDKMSRLFRLRAIEEREGRRFADLTEPFDVDYAISAFWLLPRRLLQTVGPLDERIFYAPEDVDFCLRVWQAGYRIRYVPTAVVVHHAQEISRGLNLSRAKFSHIKGLMYYFRKHRYLFRRPQFRSGPLAAS
jgi:GT2 family glycosyltransferase